jgi:hypothetical protein
MLDTEQNENEAAGGRSDSTAVLAALTCAINGVFSVNGRLGACGQHIGGVNGCAYKGDCEHKTVANV